MPLTSADTATTKHASQETERQDISSSQDVLDTIPFLELFDKQTEFSLCLKPLLQALGWQGSVRRFYEALPVDRRALDITGFRNILADLNFASQKVNLKLKSLDNRVLPCLYCPKARSAEVLLKRVGSSMLAYLSDTQKVESIAVAHNQGYAYVFSEQVSMHARVQTKSSLLTQILQPFKRNITQTLLLSMMMSLLMIMPPLFVMAIYDWVIPTQSYTLLAQLVIGALIAWLGCWGLQSLRSLLLARFAGKASHLISESLIERLLWLNASLTERVAVGSQVVRIKDCDNFYKIASSPLYAVLYDLPCSLIFLVIIGFIGGPLVVVPVVMILITIMISLIVRKMMSGDTRRCSDALMHYQSFVLEAIIHLKVIKTQKLEGIWEARHQQVAQEAIKAEYHSGNQGKIVNHVLEGMVQLGAMVILCWGTLSVFAEQLSVGGLIALMMLMWRLLAPIKSIFPLCLRFGQMQASVQQFNILDKLKSDKVYATDNINLKPATFTGQIEVQHVSLRYKNARHLALWGIDLKVRTGEFVVIQGDAGAGKTTLLKLMMGLYTPQTGSIFVDGVESSQINLHHFRQAVGYCPQQPHVFTGTIAQNLRLHYPQAHDKDLAAAATLAHVHSDILHLPHQYDTMINFSSQAEYSDSFKQRLSLAGMYLKKPPLLLLDEPSYFFNISEKSAFLSTLTVLKGSITFIVVTNDPDITAMADQVLMMTQGRLSQQGKLQ